MRARSGIALMVLLLGLGAHAEDVVEADDDDSEAQALASALPSPDESEKMLDNFKALRKKHGSVASLFAAYNRFHDGSKADGGVQALGNQEVRQLLKDIGLGNLAIRGELAKLAIRAIDSSGDGKISERELGATLAVADCWIGEGANPSADAFEVLHSCAPSVLAWWRSGWSDRLESEELRLPIVGQVLALPTAEDCQDNFLEQSLAHAKLEGLTDEVPRAGHTALRKSLKKFGVSSLLVRHLLASSLIDGLDSDRDRRLGAHELQQPIDLCCQAYGAIAGRGSSATAVGRALSLPSDFGGFTPDAFVEALRAPDASVRIKETTLDMARDVVTRALTARDDATKPLEVSPSEAVAVAAAYVRLAPQASLDLISQNGVKDEV